MKRAVKLDPLSIIINADLGNTLFSVRRYDEAIEQLRKTVEMEPDFYYARWNLGQALEMKGLIKEAEAEYEKAIALDNLSGFRFITLIKYRPVGMYQRSNFISNRFRKTRLRFTGCE